MKEYRVKGPPGTGKTHYIKRQVENAASAYGASKVIVCSLTRSAASHVASVATEIPRENIGTIHSLAYRAIGAGDIAESKAAAFNEYCGEHHQPAMKLSTGIAEQSADDDLVEPVISGEQTLGDRNYSEMNRLRARMRNRDLWPEQVKAFARLWEDWKRDAGIMDFTDLLEVALRDVATAPGDPAAFFADESQDFSRLAFELTRKWGERAVRFIHVGDPDQILYAWAGVDPDSFFARTLPHEQEKTLAQSYRVPRAVHEFAVRWIGATPGRKPIDYRPRDFDGAVRRDVSGNISLPQRVIDDAQRFIADGKSVMFMCTCSYMLHNTVKELRSRGVPFHNPYRVSRGDWNPLSSRGVSGVARMLSFVKASPRYAGESATAWTWGDVSRWAHWLKKGTLVHGAKAKLERYGKERTGETADITELSGLFNVPDEMFSVDEHDAFLDGLLTARLEWWGKLIPDERDKQLAFAVKVLKAGGITALETEPSAIVTTIHAAKGGEADIVYVFPDLSPQAHAEWMGGGDGREGIRRAFYVAATRAREQLIICQPATSLAVRL
jgi:DNA helicase-2/ATP-dependent DNA helicase PcrA